MENQRYWRYLAINFAKYYSNFGLLNIRSYVFRFLNNRTKGLMSLIGGIENKKILDVGCGSGVHMELIAPMCKKIIGIDFSKEMLMEAEKKLSRLEKHNWELKLTDVEETFPFPEENFDIVVCMGLLDYISLKRVLLECNRVLKKNGEIIFTIPKKPSLFFFLRGRVGGFLKRKIFNLPPVKNTVKYKELLSLISTTNFSPLNIGSIWTSIWIIKAKRCN